MSIQKTANTCQCLRQFNPSITAAETFANIPDVLASTSYILTLLSISLSDKGNLHMQYYNISSSSCHCFNASESFLSISFLVTSHSSGYSFAALKTNFMTNLSPIGNTIRSIDSEKAREHSEEEMIKIENIKGRLYVVGADDDSFWEAGKYIRRMTKRLEERPHTCQYVPLVYKHGTHFVLPESMLFQNQ